MKQPALSGTNAAQPPPAASRRLPPPPSAEELVAHYESQGMDFREASLKVIRLLQDAAYRAAGSRRRGMTPADAEALTKLDAVNARLAIMESKLDSKPGAATALAIGVAAGAVVRAAAEAWSVVRSATARHS